MKIGLQLPNFTWPQGPARMGGKLADIARAADEAGFHSLWLMDHFFQISMIGPAENDMLEAYTTLGYLAALTRQVRLGTMVTGAVYRHPGILVKSVTTLDVLSGGRAYFAIGAAWNDQEARGLGIPFPPLGVRFEMLEETLEIAKQMWSANDGPYRGKHHQLERTLCVPQPLSRPHPPILVAGGGEKKTLRLVAQYADACNLYGSVDTIRAKLDILKRHCEALGRDYRTIEITTLGTVDPRPGAMSSQDVIAECRALAAIGVQHAVFNMPTVHELAPIEQFRRDIIPAVEGY
jgi:F420-dependent oxidoreductase-like protein